MTNYFYTDGVFLALFELFQIAWTVLIPVGLWLVRRSVVKTGSIRQSGLTVLKTSLVIPFVFLLAVFGAIMAFAIYYLLTAGLAYSLIVPTEKWGLDNTAYVVQMVLAYLAVMLWFIGAFRTLRAIRFTVRTGRSAEPVSMLCTVLSFVIALWFLGWYGQSLYTGLREDTLTWNSVASLREFLLYKMPYLLIGASLCWFGVLHLRLRAVMRRAKG